MSLPLTTGSSCGELQPAWALCLRLHESGYVPQPVNSVTNLLFSLVLQISRAGTDLFLLAYLCKVLETWCRLRIELMKQKQKQCLLIQKLKGFMNTHSRKAGVDHIGCYTEFKVYSSFSLVWKNIVQFSVIFYHNLIIHIPWTLRLQDNMPPDHFIFHTWHKNCYSLVSL